MSKSFNFLRFFNTRPKQAVIIWCLLLCQLINAGNVIFTRYALTHGIAPAVFVALRVACSIPLLELVNILMRPSKSKSLSSSQRSEDEALLSTSESQSSDLESLPELIPSSTSSKPLLVPASSTPLISSASFSIEVRQPTWRDTAQIIALALCGITANFLLWTNGLKLTSATTTGITSAVTPVVVAIIAIICKREKGTPIKVMGITIACGGALVTLDPRNLSVDLGIILLLTASTLWAAFLVFQKPVLEIFSPAYFTARVFLYGGPGLFIAAGIDWENIITLLEVPWLSWVAVVYSSAINTVFAYILTGYAIRHSSSVLAGVFINFQPILVASFAVLFLSESFTLIQGLGTIMIGFGVIVVTVARYREDKDKITLEPVVLDKLEQLEEGDKFEQK